MGTMEEELRWLTYDESRKRTQKSCLIQRTVFANVFTHVTLTELLLIK